MRKATCLVLILALCTVAAHAGEVWEGQWIEARSPNFVVTSALGKSDTTQLVQELEDFRTLVGAVTNAAELKERVPTHVLVFKDPVADIGLRGLVSGGFYPRMRDNYAVARGTAGGWTRTLQGLGFTLQYDYTVFLIRNQAARGYPSWYAVGLAEVLGAADLHDDRFVLGGPPPGRLQVLSQPGRWLPYSRIIDASQLSRLNGHEADLFYSQAWALVHYLSFGKPGLDLPVALKEYLADLERGTAPVPAFEKAFHEDMATLDKTVRRYLKQARSTNGTLTHTFDPAGIAVRELASDEVAARLAMLSLSIRQFKPAGKFADAALAANPDNAAALVVRADLLKIAGKYPDAEALYVKAIVLEPDSDLHHLDFGQYWLDRAAGAADDPVRHDYFNKARLEFYKADKLNDHNPETLAYYGFSYLLEKVNEAKGVATLEYAHTLLPSNINITLMLAQLYVTTGQPIKARPLLQAVSAWGSARQVEFVDKILADMDKPADTKVPGGTAAESSVGP